LPEAENKVTVVAVDKKGRRIETAFMVACPAGAVRNASGAVPQFAVEKLDVADSCYSRTLTRSVFASTVLHVLSNNSAIFFGC